MDTSKYVSKSTFLALKEVKQWNLTERQVIITGPGGEHTFTNPKTQETTVKAQIPVKRITTQEELTWTLSETAIRDLSGEMESANTEDWVGAVVKLVIKDAGNGHETLSATVITRPR